MMSYDIVLRGGEVSEFCLGDFRYCLFVRLIIWAIIQLMNGLYDFLNQLRDYVQSQRRVMRFALPLDGGITPAHLHLMDLVLSGDPLDTSMDQAIFTPSFFDIFSDPVVELSTFSEYEGHSIPFLFVVILSQNHHALTVLLDAGLDVFSVDTRGFTALHLCHIYGFSDTAKHLRQYGLQDHPTLDGLTCQDIDSLVFSVQEDDFIPFLKIPSADLWKVWLQNSVLHRPPLFSSLQPHSLVTRYFLSYLAQSFDAYAHLDFTREDHGLPVQIVPSASLGGEHDLVASVEVSEGCVFEFAGLWCESADFSDRNFSGLDASQFGSGFQYMNDGPPNCRFVFWNWKGISKVLVLTTQPIPKGDSFRVYYGPRHRIRQPEFDTQFIESRPDLVDAFVRDTEGLTQFFGYDSTGFYRLILSNQEVHRQSVMSDADPSCISLFLKVFYAQDMWSYILTTPTVLHRVCVQLEVSVPESLLHDVFHHLFGDDLRLERPWAIRFYDHLCGFS
jgi:hypothetical protein